MDVFTVITWRLWVGIYNMEGMCYIEVSFAAWWALVVGDGNGNLHEKMKERYG